MARSPRTLPRRDAALRALALAAALAFPLTGCAASPPMAAVSTHLATVEVVDRTSGAPLPVYVSGSERWIIGTPGNEYAIRIRNHTGTRILGVLSVDGVNAITGETAAPDQTGYVLEPYGSVEVAGWRKSVSNTAAFYFTDVASSYAARTGRPLDVGVIGVALFRERVPVAWRQPSTIANDAKDSARAEAPAAAPPLAQAPAGAVARELEAGASQPSAESAAKRRDDRLGTGHGRSETSWVTRVAFDRATLAPEATVAIRYDRREALVARGIVPGPRYATRVPSPFPAWPGFVPDPR